MGVELSKGARAVVMAVRARSLLTPGGLKNFLSGSDPEKGTGDLLLAGDYLKGEDRKVVTGEDCKVVVAVLKDAQQAHRLPELLKAAQGENSVGEFALDVLKCHESAESLNKAVLADLAGADAAAIAVALKVVKLREDTRAFLRQYVDSAIGDMPVADRAARVVCAVRAAVYLPQNGLAKVLSGETVAVHLAAMKVLGSEAEFVARHLREQGDVSDLVVIAPLDEHARIALQNHKDVGGIVTAICNGLVSDDKGQVQLATDLLNKRRNDVLQSHDAVEPLFAAAAGSISGVFDVLVAHKAPTKILFAMVEEALMSSDRSDEAEARYAIALQLVKVRKDLADMLAHNLGVSVQHVSESDAQDAAK